MKGTLREELAATVGCKVCAYLRDLAPSEVAEWQGALASPVSEIANMSVVRALKRRGVDLTEAAVRRHRSNHAAR